MTSDQRQSRKIGVMDNMNKKRLFVAGQKPSTANYKPPKTGDL